MYRLLLVISLTILIAACGGDDGGTNNTGSSSSGGTVAAPSALSYTSPVGATVGQPLGSLSPTVTGSVSSYSVSPALPAGITLNSTTGVISGTPTAVAAQTAYTISAENSGGKTSFALTLSVAAAVQVSGTAAEGAPIAGATVTLKDAAGHTATAITASDGSYSITVNGLTAPFLIGVTSGSGTTLYGYAAGSGTANLDPYTSVALQAYYTAQSSNVATVFGGTLSAASFPTASQLALLVAPITGLLQPYLSNAGVTQAAQFSPFTTSFSANHTGFDQVLDRTTLSSSLLAFTVDNGSGANAGSLSTSVQVQVTAGSATTYATAAVSATTSDGATSAGSSSTQTVQVGTTSEQQTALANAESGVTTLLNSLAQLVTTKGAAITTTDTLALIDPNYLDKGADAASLAQTLQQFLAAIPAGDTFSASIYRTNRYSAAAATLDATVVIQVTSGSTVLQTNYLDENDNVDYGMVFKQETDGSWKFYGQQTQFNAHIGLTQALLYDQNTGSSSPVSTSLDMQAQATVPVGSLSGVTVSGPSNSLPDCSLTPSPATKSSVTLVQDPGLYDGEDRYDLACATTDAGAISGTPPPAGTVYTFNLSEAGGGSVQQPYTLNAVTSDSGDLLEINGTSRASFASATTGSSLAGTTVTLQFSPPTTYPVLYSYISAYCQNASEVSGGGGNDIDGTLGSIPAGTNSGTISIPAQCDGSAIDSLALSVNFVGIDGEASEVTQNLLR